jgi:drug/metabolite transporter (DMT)-like permease
MIVGVLAGLGTGALWGLTFVAPRAIAPFTVLDLTVARYGVCGVAALAFMLADARFRLDRRHATAGVIGTGLALGGLAYSAYFICVAVAVQLAGPAIPPLVIGTLPVLLGILGNWRDRDLPWRTLAVPLTLVGLGLLTVNAEALLTGPDPSSRRAVVLGTLSALAALAIWGIYAFVNAEVSRRPDAPGSLPWAGLQTLGAGLGVLPLIPLSSWVAGGQAVPPLASPEAWSFVAWVLVLGLAGSWLATWLWVVSSQRLSLALAAQLIVAESVFGLVYGFLYEARWPTGPEAAGAALQIAGVILAIRLFHGSRRQSAA